MNPATYSLHLSSVIGQPGGKGSCGVHLLIKPTHFLTKHGSKRQTTQTRGKVLTRHTETNHLERRERRKDTEGKGREKREREREREREGEGGRGGREGGTERE